MSCTKEELSSFLADYAATLLGCGATCIRIVRNVRRIAGRFGMQVDVTVMPSHIEVAEWCCDHTPGIVVVRRIASNGINFSLNASLSRLSWDIADGKCTFDEALQRYQQLLEAPRTGKWEVLLLASAANASFCRLFGGDAIAMLIVFLSTAAGFRLRQILLEEHVDIRLTVLCASFFSTALSAFGEVFAVGATPQIAIASSVLYLIPGVPYINVVSDIIDRHYLCAFSRFMDATILTICLSLGLCLGLFVLGIKWF